MHRTHLRHATGDLHQRLDAAVSSLDIATAHGYSRFLGLHAQVLPSIEAALQAGGMERLFDDWQDRRRTSALMLDLDDIGLARPQVEACVAGDTAHQLGMLYVLEGSRLGGRILLGQAQGRHRETRLNFLRHGIDNSFWPRFLAVLEAQPDDAHTRCAMEDGARQVFGRYLDAAGASATIGLAAGSSFRPPSIASSGKA